MASRQPTRRGVDRGQLQQIIAGLSEGVLLLDPRGTIVWANEAALAMHGCAKLEELGTTAAGYRKRFVLKYLNHRTLTAKQHPLARVTAGDHFAELTVQVTRRDDDSFCRVHEVRSLKLTNPDRQIESLALVIRDITERVSAEELFERTFGANPAPALICRLADRRYIKVNQGFLDMTGYTRDDVLGCAFAALDVLQDAEHRDEALRAFEEHHTIPQQEASLPVNGGGTKFVIVAGQPIEVDDEPCMLFTFNDLEARKKAELSLRQSEERFAKAFRLAPVPMMVCGLPALRILEINDAFATVTGHQRDDVLGKASAELDLWKDAAAYRQLRSALEAHQDIRNLDIAIRTRGGAVIDGLLSAEPVTIQNEACVLFVVQDITERKRSEMDLVAAIETVMKDTSWFSRTVMEKLAQIRHPDGVNGAKGELGTLTPREREVLGLICKGHGDAEISALLKLSRNTVRNHVATLYAKIGVNRRSAAVVWGRERGLAGY